MLDSQLEIDFRPKLSGARDQGNRPTCLSHAISTSHEFLLSSDITLSVEYLHYFATNGKPSNGAALGGAIEALEEAGQPEERHCPYFNEDPPAGWHPNNSMSTYRRYSTRMSNSINSIAESLHASLLPVLGISLPFNFFHPSYPWIISSDTKVYGLHAVVAVGLASAEARSMVLIRNSWGKDWGNNGYVFLNEDFLNSHLFEVLVLGGDPKNDNVNSS
jgi:C1A family cysteine protease